MAQRDDRPGDILDAIRLALAVAGAGLVGLGAWMHYPPLGFITAGALLVAIAVVGAVRAR